MNTEIEINTKRVESIVFSRDDRKFIELGNYALDFKKEYLYLGTTKSGQVILGDIIQTSYNGSQEKIRKYFGKIYDNKIHAEGCRYIEALPTIEEIKTGVTA